MNLNLILRTFSIYFYFDHFRGHWRSLFIENTRNDDHFGVYISFFNWFLMKIFEKINFLLLKYWFKVDKKRHLGNDIVAIIFQDSNTPFCPTLMKTKVTHSYVVVQPMDIDGPTQYKVILIFLYLIFKLPMCEFNFWLLVTKQNWYFWDIRVRGYWCN